MLLTMHIKNIALIEEIDIDFHEQLNILTGETGAGKSIIIGSLGICLGGKFPKELLRDDTKDGLVELVFSVDQPAIVEALEKLEVTPDEDGTLLISRRLSPNGRTVNRVNDTTVTITRLKEIASLLIDLHAQHEQQTLLKPAKHLEILDRFGGEDIQKLKKQVQEDYHIYRELEEEKKKGSMDEAKTNAWIFCSIRLRKSKMRSWSMARMSSWNGSTRRRSMQRKSCNMQTTSMH